MDWRLESDMAEKQYLDVNVADFSEMLTKLVNENRAIYEMQRDATKKIVAQLNSEVTLADGQVIVGVTWTRWGQMQAIVADKPQPKAQARQRQSLTAYRNENSDRQI